MVILYSFIFPTIHYSPYNIPQNGWIVWICDDWYPIAWNKIAPRHHSPRQPLHPHQGWSMRPWPSATFGHGWGDLGLAIIVTTCYDVTRTCDRKKQICSMQCCGGKNKSECLRRLQQSTVMNPMFEPILTSWSHFQAAWGVLNTFRYSSSEMRLSPSWSACPAKKHARDFPLHERTEWQHLSGN